MPDRDPHTAAVNNGGELSPQTAAADEGNHPETPRSSVAGFGVTFGDMFKRRLTEQYPEYKKPTAPRFHGRHQLNRHPDGLEKCVGCELCAWACPADAIYVEGADNTDEERYSPGERYGRVYQINYLRCILCGLCIEACPTRALTMTNEYELADSSRESLIYTKKELLAGLEEGMVDSPHAIFPGMTEQDYYRGLVTEAAPGTVPQQVTDSGDPQASADTFGGGEPAASEVFTEPPATEPPAEPVTGIRTDEEGRR